MFYKIGVFKTFAKFIGNKTASANKIEYFTAKVNFQFFPC